MKPIRHLTFSTRRAAAAAILLALGGTAGYVAADQFSSPEGVPRLVTYEGYLSQNGSAVTDGVHTLRFQLFTVASGGTSVWTSVRGVQTQGGHFATTLGDTSGGQPAIVLSDLAGGDVYLEAAVQVTVGSFEVLGRQRVTSVPYALRAANSSLAELAEDVAAGSALDARLAGQNARLAGGARVVSAYILNTTGSPSIASQYGGWLASVSDPGGASTGRVDLNVVPGMFTSPPHCVATVNDGSLSDVRVLIPTTTSLIAIQATTPAPGDVDRDFYVICVGP